MKEKEFEYLTISFPLSCLVGVDRGLPKDLGERDNYLTIGVFEMKYSRHPTSLICKEGEVGVKSVEVYVFFIINDSNCDVSGVSWLIGT